LAGDSFARRVVKSISDMSYRFRVVKRARNEGNERLQTLLF
jgi:hypothetical protein